MFLSEKKRQARWTTEAARVAILSQQARLHFDALGTDWLTLMADPRFVSLLVRHELPGLVVRRVAREELSVRRDAINVLELAVLIGVLSSLMSHADVVRWMASHTPDVLAHWQAVCEAPVRVEANQ
jgi:hypothetical protein